MGFFLIISAQAAEVRYTISATALDLDNNTIFSSQNITQECELNCTAPIPSFEIRHNITNYSINYETNKEYMVYFYSTQNNFSVGKNDTIVIEIIPTVNETEEPSIVCNESRCDNSCVVCSDNKCHEQGFNCIEEVVVEKISPNATNIGVAQINILLRNKGNVDLSSLYAEISGDGLYTLEKIPIAELAAGDKDYAFVKLNATKAGIMDMVVKLYVGDLVKDRIVGQINVLPIDVAEEKEEVNLTEFSDTLNELRERSMLLEQEYQNKMAEQYPVQMIYDNLKDARKYITDAQSYYLEGDYKKAEVSLKIAQENLKTVETELENSTKKEVKVGDKIRNNLIYIGSMAAAVVSILTAWSLVKGHINKQKILELKQKLNLEKEKEKELKKELWEKGENKGKK